MSGLDVSLSGRRGRFVLDAAFEAPAGMVTALFGPSGAGKTSLLRAIAGLERFEGRCALGSEVWQDGRRFVPAHRRAVGYVFQEASLLAHLTVRANAEFGLRRSTGPARIGFDEVVDLLGLARLLERAPDRLSGGERQRVALARALLSQPSLLLLDEPLSALDREAREEILPYFEALRRRIDLPVVLVTHEIGEVERLADRLVLLRDGAVVGSGPLNQMLVSAAAGLRKSRDAAAVLAGSVIGYDSEDGLSEIAVEGARLWVAGRAGRVGAPVRMRIASRDVSLATVHPSATTILNVVAAMVAAIDPVSEAEAVVTLSLGGQALLARVTRRSLRTLGLRPGQQVFAQVKGVSLIAS